MISGSLARARLTVCSQSLFVALPLMLWQLVNAGAERHIVAWFVGGLFAIIATTISVLDITMHVLHYRVPSQQRFVVRILWMVRAPPEAPRWGASALPQVPIYAIESWLSLRFKEQALWFESARDWCEGRWVLCLCAWSRRGHGAMHVR